MDTPLLYETGWSKKLTYVVAFSAEEVVDVGARYTNNLSEMKQRRTLVPEPWLQAEIARLCQTLRTQVRGARCAVRATYALTRQRAVPLNRPGPGRALRLGSPDRVAGAAAAGGEAPGGRGH